MRFLVLTLFGLVTLVVRSQDTIKIALNLTPDEQAELNYNQAVKALENNNIDTSIALLTRCLIVKTSFDKAYSNRAVAYTRQKKFSEALLDINSAVSLNPQNPDHYFNKSLVFFNMQLKDSQNFALDQCLRLNGEHADAAYYKGLLCFEGKEFDKSIGYYSVAIKSKPLFAYAYNDRASAHLAKDELDEAIKDYKKSVSIDSSFAFVFNNLGSTFRRKKEYTYAIEAYNKALKLNPSYLLALINRGNTHFDMDNLKLAQIDYEEAIALSPANSFAYNNLASIAIKTKDYKKAKELSSRAIELDIKNGAAYYNRGIARQMLHDEDGCCSDWNKALQNGVDGAKAFINLNCTN